MTFMTSCTADSTAILPWHLAEQIIASRPPCPWLAELHDAARERGLNIVTVFQGRMTAFSPFIEADEPTAVIIGDDLHQALGPAAFNAECMREVIKMACGAIIVCADPLPEYYACAARTALHFRRPVLIIETLDPWIRAWDALLLEINPDIRELIIATRPEGGNDNA